MSYATKRKRKKMVLASSIDKACDDYLKDLELLSETDARLKLSKRQGKKKKETVSSYKLFLSNKNVGIV